MLLIYLNKKQGKLVGIDLHATAAKLLPDIWPCSFQTSLGFSTQYNSLQYGNALTENRESKELTY